jgi:hypothetical protein
VVFDRGGWSPDLFADLLDEGFDLLTYRKGKIRPEPVSVFSEHTFTDERGVVHRWQLADRKVRLNLSAKGAKRHGRTTITLRQIVRLSPDGHQTHILTSRFDLSAAEIQLVTEVAREMALARDFLKGWMSSSRLSQRKSTAQVSVYRL